MLEVEKDTSIQWHFWTVTLMGDHHNGDTGASLREWRKSWDKLMKRVRRDLKKLRYIRVFETHKDGTLHVHMLCDATYSDVIETKEKDGRNVFTSATFARHLSDLSLGWRHDLRPIITTDYEENGAARNVSAYTVKYLTKDIQGNVRECLREAGLDHVRMIQTSQGWANTPLNETVREWKRGAMSDHEYNHLREAGISVDDANLRKTVKPSDFEGLTYYPNWKHDERYIESDERAE